MQDDRYMRKKTPGGAEKGTVPLIRLAEERDIPEIVELVREFAQGHPSEDLARNGKKIEAAYFGDNPAGELIVAERKGRAVGMVQWYRQYDMFWEVYLGIPEWLFVREDSRGLGISIALIAFLCERVRRAGGEFIYGPGAEATTSIFTRYAFDAGSAETFRLSGEAFHQWADLAGSSPRQIIRNLPPPELNRADPKPRA